MPIDQRLYLTAQLNGPHPANENSVGVPLDGVVELAIKHCKTVSECQRSCREFLPPGILIAIHTLETAPSGKTVGQMLLATRQHIDAEAAMPL